MQTVDQTRPTVLFVNESEEETIGMTRGLSVNVVQARHVEKAKEAMINSSVKGVFIDITAIRLEQMTEIHDYSRQHSIPVFILAHASEVPAAIQYVKHGARGFLLKGLSESDSLLKLMHYATSHS